MGRVIAGSAANGQTYEVRDLVGADGLWELSLTRMRPDGSGYTNRFRDSPPTDTDEPRVCLQAGPRMGGEVLVVVRCSARVTQVRLRTGRGDRDAAPTFSDATGSGVAVFATPRTAPMILECLDAHGSERAVIDIAARLPPSSSDLT